MSDTPVVWTPAGTAGRSAMGRFLAAAGTRAGRPLPDYAALQAWALAEPRAFWPSLLAFSGLAVEGSPEPAFEGEGVEHARFFPAVRLNYAENLLRATDPSWDAAPALLCLDERGGRETVTRAELRRRVAHAAHALAALGVREGDRVVAIARNAAEPVVLCLACAAIGATWSSVGPDLGADAVRRRFGPLEPAVLCFHGRHDHHGARRLLGPRVAEVAASLPSLRATIALDDEPPPALAVPVHPLSALVPEGTAPDGPWPRFPFNHPLFVLFSSGTTGPPKCIVHGAGGTLLEHWKELALHSDLGPGDRLLFMTSCGWMMWNWQLSALACGATVVLHDGSPTYPAPDALWDVVAREGVTAFGTSPAYLRACEEAGVEPGAGRDLSALRMMFSTGSVIHEGQFDWVRERVKALPLQSISGGTDIIGCFVLGNPLLPVRRGESQCTSLGYDVRVADERGVHATGTGELVCVQPFPSRPIGLFGDPDGRRFHDAYFAARAGMWTHGDLLTLSPDGGARVRGRIDGTLNVRGVRIGPAEIYAILREVPEVAEGMALEQRWEGELGGSRLVLLVVLAPGTTLDRALTLRIKRELSTRGSANHVPAVIVQVDELPMTFNGKRSERAATDALDGVPVRNRDALRNPAVLDALARHPLLARPA